MTRRYDKRQRAQQGAETRQRIVDATVALHESIGGPSTTVTAIAGRAGVSRLTVYRHFPDERSLLAACTSTYLAANPPPDPGEWAAIGDPQIRLLDALSELYPFYRRNQGLLARADQEMPTNPILAEVLSGYTAAVAAMRDVLDTGWPNSTGDGLLRAAIGHAVAFGTWRSLAVDQGLADDRAADLMLRLVEASSESSFRPTRQSLRRARAARAGRAD